MVLLLKFLFISAPIFAVGMRLRGCNEDVGCSGDSAAKKVDHLPNKLDPLLLQSHSSDGAKAVSLQTQVQQHITHLQNVLGKAAANDSLGGSFFFGFCFPALLICLLILFGGRTPWPGKSSIEKYPCLQRMFYCCDPYGGDMSNTGNTDVSNTDVSIWTFKRDSGGFFFQDLLCLDLLYYQYGMKVGISCCFGFVCVFIANISYATCHKFPENKFLEPFKRFINEKMLGKLFSGVPENLKCGNVKANMYYSVFAQCIACFCCRLQNHDDWCKDPVAATVSSYMFVCGGCVSNLILRVFFWSKAKVADGDEMNTLQDDVTAAREAIFGKVTPIATNEGKVADTAAPINK